jgi:antirestriction protein
MNQQLNTPKEVRTMNPEHQPRESEPHSEHAPRPEVESRTGPRIYVASLSDYNAGRLHGAWIDATHDPEDIQEEIAAMLRQSPEPIAEEWALHDYEGFFGLSLSEHESVDRVSRIARGSATHGAAFAAWISICDPDEETIDRFEDCYLGSFPSRETYAEETVDDLGYQQMIDEAIPDYLAPYVRLDAAALIHDAELNGDITITDNPDGTVSVFHA